MHFTDGADAQTEYTYDGNGNLTADLNLGIRKIEYNPLNLPQKILFSDGDSICYLYGADATKLRAFHTIGGTTSRTDYAGNRIYTDGRLDKILTGKGSIIPTTPAEATINRDTFVAISAKEEYNVFTDNCAHVVQRSLKAAGVRIDKDKK